MESRQARITRAPLLARSRAVSLPMPVLAPVITTVLPVNFLVLVQTPVVYMRYALKPPSMEKTTKPIWTSMGNEQKNVNIFLICKSNDGNDKNSQREMTLTVSSLRSFVWPTVWERCFVPSKKGFLDLAQLSKLGTITRIGVGAKSKIDATVCQLWVVLFRLL